MEKFAFAMTLKPGCKEDYKQRHDKIWPELSSVLKEAGVSDYSIYLDESSNKLFAVLMRSEDHTMDDLPKHPVVIKWWKFMADIMLTNEDNSPLVTPVELMFHMQ